MKYITWGADKQRNEIVIASGHDADIVSGGRSEKTQNLDIAGQAAARVRMFDPRKCQTIYNLNGIAATVLTDAARAVRDQVDQDVATARQNMRR